MFPNIYCRLYRLLGLFLGLCFSLQLLLCSTTLYAQDASTTHRDNPADYPVTATSHTHSGTSPFSPPDRSDTTFIVDESSGLDTNCTFRSGGPLIFTLKIDRVAGDIQKLRDNGLISEFANLRMPAYDVDFVGASGVNPERDRVIFNGHVVQEEFLSGENDTWILNNFRVPIEWVNFPSNPTTGTLIPADNIIQIDIDTANTEEVWCTAIDWAALSAEIVPPILMVHGILSSGDTWHQANKFNWLNALNDMGIPNDTISMGNLDSIQNNAQKIKTKYDELYHRWGVEFINIVAHSKGGIDSRQFAEINNHVKWLFQLGTPNAGSPLANTAQAGVIGLGAALGGAIPTVLLTSLAAPAGYQLTTPYMGTYNLFHSSNPKTSYVSIAGDYRFGGWGIVDSLLYTYYEDRSDTIVPVYSVHALDYAVHLTYPSKENDKSAQHTEQTSSEGVYNFVKPYLKIKSLPAALAQSGELKSSSVNTVPDIVQTGTIHGQIMQGEVMTHSLHLDSVVTTTFVLYHPTGDLGLALTSPSGIKYDAASIVGNQEVELITYDGGDGLKYSFFGFSHPEVGSWTVEISGTSVITPVIKEPYFLYGWMASSPIMLEAHLDKTSYHQNEPITISAKVTDNSIGIAGATVKAIISLPDESISTTVLHDDGIDGDSKGNDGIYTGIVENATQSGVYRILITGEKTSQPTFSREQLLIGTVSRSTTVFNGQYSDSGNDLNSDGLYDSLVINVGLDVTDLATYHILGSLSDKNGDLITVAEATVELAAGKNTIDLSFDGASIFRHGIDGPYTLNIARLAEDDQGSPLPLDEKVNVYKTSDYNFIQFQGSTIAIPGTGKDRGVDTNGNGRFDQLEISLDAFIAQSGLYEWSARLANKNGKEIGIATGSATLNAGKNTILFTFNGESIGADGVDGPYALNDLLIFSSSTSAVLFNVYETTTYLASQFEGAPQLLPDLIVQSITATENSVEVVVKNQGAGPVPPEQDFWVDVYISPSTIPAVVNDVWNFMGDRGIVWGVVSPAVPLPSGGVITLSVGGPYYWPSLSNFSFPLPSGTPIYAQVDSANATTTYGGVQESHEASNGVYNNILGPVFSKASESAEQPGNSLYIPLVVNSSPALDTNSANTPSKSGDEELPIRP